MLRIRQLSHISLFLSFSLPLFLSFSLSLSLLLYLSYQEHLMNIVMYLLLLLVLLKLGQFQRIMKYLNLAGIEVCRCLNYSVLYNLVSLELRFIRNY
jgi:hypothetical protein